MSLATTVQGVLIQIVLLLTIFFIGIIVARASRRIIERTIIEANSLKIVQLNFALILARIVEFAVYVITGLMIANELNATRVTLSILALIVGIIVVGNIILLIIFSVPNIFARVIVRERKLRVGQKFKSSIASGRVVKKRLTDFVVRCEKSDQLMIIPYWSLRQ